MIAAIFAAILIGAAVLGVIAAPAWLVSRRPRGRHGERGDGLAVLPWYRDGWWRS